MQNIAISVMKNQWRYLVTMTMKASIRYDCRESTDNEMTRYHIWLLAEEGKEKKKNLLLSGSSKR